ncbi:exodeoxyribonuclease VII large subunit [Actinobacillus vicugnae]|uniref:exodeoxyribonuclease VII large subunit n=1 Tax=Actinobacillus vicugnae TaxID=2573093 RepID=UPI0012427EB9|nr:exodeoxyribonuclease VII large subunit [Actinobacillus vicugnae]
MNNILTITQLNYSVRNLLEMELGQVWLTGEISNFSQPVSGHWYLTLKDENAQVRGAMFRMKNQRVAFRPQNGTQVLVRANVSLYEPRGDYQIIIESMQPAGDGLLQQQFEQLKMKLAAEGLFAQEKKKPIPAFAKRVGIITSSSGAALQDILNILKRRDPSLSIIIYPTLVQGKEASQDIVATIDLANLRNECDVLIVGRGGGSLEDLWCFNEEVVAQAIFRSNIPIISAVGHETDVTIADFVADLRAPTPSAAAELVSRDQQELIRQLQHQFDRISLAFDRLWNEKSAGFAQLKLRLNAQHPVRQIQMQQQQLTQFNYRLESTIHKTYLTEKQKLAQLLLRLTNQHPQHQLQQQQTQLKQAEYRLTQAIEQTLLAKQHQWKNLTERVKRNPLPHYVAKQTQQHAQLAQQLQFAMEKKFSKAQQKFQALCTKIDGLSPLKILARGYSVTQNSQGEILCSTANLKVGSQITTKLSQGEIVSEILKID